ncbi:unnamed protein product [Blepharisma stoltei]|uniref:Protein kinase domain-containing protein n=1 Tax=Blepharisma stoltei TaxID=1481888 RepID=A0AAU9JBF8_9CILI|nr:unnamed protein product [Blepharisma stoltei]
MDSVSILNYFDAVYELKKRAYLPLSQPYHLSLSHEHFWIEKQINETQFLGVNEKGTEFDIQVITSSSIEAQIYEKRYFEMATLVHYLSGVAKTCARELDKFYLMTELKNSMSLDEFLVHKNNVEIPKVIRETSNLCQEVIIRAAEELISQVASARRMGMVIGNISPDNLYIEISQSPIRPVYTLNGYGIDLKLDMINARSLSTAFPLNPDIFPFDDKNIVDLWGVGVCLYAAVTRTVMDEMPHFMTSDKDEVTKMILAENYIPSLSEFIAELVTDRTYTMKAVDHLFSRLFKTWLYLFKETERDSLDLSELDSKALISSFYFKDKHIRKRGFEQLFAKDCGVPKILSTMPNCFDVTRTVIKVATHYKFYEENKEFLVNALVALNELMKNNAWIRAESGPLGLYRLFYIKLDFTNAKLRKEIIRYLSLLCKNNTLTALIIAKQKRIINDLLYPRYLNESSDLTVMLPFCGRANIKRIKIFRDYRVIGNDFEEILALSAIPIHFKRQRPEIILDQIQELMSRMVKTSTVSQEFNESLSIALEIIYEVLFKCKHEHEINRSGECCKLFTKSHSYNTIPFLTKCTRCNMNFCPACSRFHSSSQSHSLQFLIYTLNPKATCACASAHPSAFTSAVLSDLREEKQIELFATGGVEHENHIYHTEKESKEISITSVAEINVFNDDIRPVTIFYYEVYVQRAGLTGNIKVGLEGTGVEYCGDTGDILMDGEVIEHGPRFGSKDVVGIGITSSYYVYFTYNGFNLHLYVECEPIREIRPLVRVKGKHIRVQLKFNHFMCDPKSYPAVSQARICQLMKEIEEWIKYYAEKTKIFPFMKSNADSIKRIVSNLSSQLPLNFPYFDAHIVPIKASSKSICNII